MVPVSAWAKPTYGSIHGDIAHNCAVQALRYNALAAARRHAASSSEEASSDEEEPLVLAGSASGSDSVSASDYAIDIDSLDQTGKNDELIKAVSKRNIERARLLIQHRADVNAKDSNLEFPLVIAAQHGDQQMTQLLIDAKADLEQSNLEEDVAARKSARFYVARFENGLVGHPLFIAMKMDRLAVASLLLQHGAKPDAGKVVYSQVGIPICSTRPIEAAIRKKSVRGVQMLLDAGAAVSKWDMSEALIAGQAQIAKLLMSKLSAEEKAAFFTPWHISVASKNAEILQMFLEEGASIHAADEHGSTAMHMVETSGFGLHNWTHLLKAGADVNGVDDHGNTPLHLIVSKKTWPTPFVKFLLAHGADPNLKNKGGYTAYQCALNADKITSDKYRLADTLSALKAVTASESICCALM